MSPQTWHRQVPTSQAAVPPTCSTLTGAELTPAKRPCIYTHRVVSDSLRPCRPWLSGRRILQARILEHIGQYWFPCPSRALYFLLPSPPTSMNPCNPSSCTTSIPGPHRGRPKSSRAASGANPSGRPTCRGGNKTTTETQGDYG